MKNAKGAEKIKPHRKRIYQLADGVITKPSGLVHFNKRIANSSVFVLPHQCQALFLEVSFYLIGTIFLIFDLL